MREDIKAKKFNKYNPDSQPNLYELDKFLRKSGYRLVDTVSHTNGELELVIEPIKAGYLYPEIFHDIEDHNFYAKVVDHGLLVSHDLEGILEGYTTALGVLKYLDSLDLDTLEIKSEE